MGGAGYAGGPDGIGSGLMAQPGAAAVPLYNRQQHQQLASAVSFFNGASAAGGGQTSSSAS